MISRNKSGFTLIELMIAIAIFSILMTVSVVTLNSGDKNRELKNSALLVLGGIKQMQTMALGGEAINGIVPDYYLIKILKCGSNCSYSLKGIYYDANSVAHEVHFQTSTLPKTKVSSTSVAIEFFPPRGYATSTYGTTTTVIQLVHTSDANIKWCVIFNSISGRAYISNTPPDCP